MPSGGYGRSSQKEGNRFRNKLFGVTLSKLAVNNNMLAMTNSMKMLNMNLMNI